MSKILLPIVGDHGVSVNTIVTANPQAVVDVEVILDISSSLNQQNLSGKSLGSTVVVVGDGMLSLAISSGAESESLWYAIGEPKAPDLESFTIEIDEDEIEVDATTYVMISSVTPTNADVSDISWTTSNIAIATVNKTTGDITGISEGSVNIRGTVSGIEETAGLTIVGKPKAPVITLQPIDHQMTGEPIDDFELITDGTGFDSIQWQYEVGGTGTWYDAEGYNDKILSGSAITIPSYAFRAVYKNSVGETKSDVAIILDSK